MLAEEMIDMYLFEIEDGPKGFPIPDHVKAVRINKGVYSFAVWENPEVVSDSDGRWQGSFLQKDGGWNEVAPTSRHGYASKQELLKELLIRVKSRSNLTGPHAPYMLGKR